MWAPGGVFRNVGFMIEQDGKFELYVHPNLLRKTEVAKDAKLDESVEGPLVYGYCWATRAEIEQAKKVGYVLDPNTSLEEVFQRFPKPDTQTAAQQSPPANPMLPANRK